MKKQTTSHKKGAYHFTSEDFHKFKSYINQAIPYMPLLALVFLSLLMHFFTYNWSYFFVLYSFTISAYAVVLLKKGSGKFWLVVLLGTVYRIIPLFGLSGLFSTDIFQYEYLGTKILGGSIPYRDFPAPYPPISLYITVPFLMADDIRLMKLFFVICDIVIIYTVYNQLRSQNIPSERIKLVSLILLFCPVSLLEYSISGHNDSFTLLLLLTSLILLDRKPILSSVFLSLSICSKIFPVVIIPLILKHLLSENRKVLLRFLLPLFSTLGFISLPFILLSYNAYMKMLVGITRVSIPNGFFQTLLFMLFGGVSENLIVPVLIVSFTISTAIFLLIFAFSFWQEWSLMKSLSVTFLFLPFLLPQFQPWYLLWALPFVILYTSKNWKSTTAYMLLLLSIHISCYLVSPYINLT